MKSPSERKKAQRIRERVADGRSSAEDRAWLASYEDTVSSTVTVTAPAASAAPVAVAVTVADGAAAAEAVAEDLPPSPEPPPVEAPRQIDMGPGGPAPATPAPVTATPATQTPGDAPRPSLDTGMTDEVARAASGMVFTGINAGWRHFGDRDAPDPSSEQRKILARVIANYALKYGWTSELDDMILLVTVIGTYNAQCARAPLIVKKKEGEK